MEASALAHHNALVASTLQSRAKALQRSVSRQELRDAKAQFERGSFVGLRMATLLSRKDPAIMIPPDQPEAC